MSHKSVPSAATGSAWSSHSHSHSHSHRNKQAPDIPPTFSQLQLTEPRVLVPPVEGEPAIELVCRRMREASKKYVRLYKIHQKWMHGEKVTNSQLESMVQNLIPAHDTYSAVASLYDAFRSELPERFQDSLHLCEESVGPAQGGESSGGVVDTETVNADAGAGGAVLLEAEQVQQEEEARAVAEFTSPCEQESAVATQPSDLDALDLPFLYHLLVVLDTLAMRNPDQLFYRKARAIALIEAGLSRSDLRVVDALADRVLSTLDSEEGEESGSPSGVRNLQVDENLVSVVLDLSEKPEGVFLDVQQVEGESDFELPAVSNLEAYQQITTLFHAVESRGFREKLCTDRPPRGRKNDSRRAVMENEEAGVPEEEKEEPQQEAESPAQLAAERRKQKRKQKRIRKRQLAAEAAAAAAAWADREDTPAGEQEKPPTDGTEKPLPRRERRRKNSPAQKQKSPQAENPEEALEAVDAPVQVASAAPEAVPQRVVESQSLPPHKSPNLEVLSDLVKEQGSEKGSAAARQENLVENPPSSLSHDSTSSSSSLSGSAGATGNAAAFQQNQQQFPGGVPVLPMFPFGPFPMMGMHPGLVQQLLPYLYAQGVPGAGFPSTGAGGGGAVPQNMMAAMAMAAAGGHPAGATGTPSPPYSAAFGVPVAPPASNANTSNNPSATASGTPNNAAPATNTTTNTNTNINTNTNTNTTANSSVDTAPTTERSRRRPPPPTNPEVHPPFHPSPLEHMEDPQTPAALEYANPKPSPFQTEDDILSGLPRGNAVPFTPESASSTQSAHPPSYQESEDTPRDSRAPPSGNLPLHMDMGPFSQSAGAGQGMPGLPQDLQALFSQFPPPPYPYTAVPTAVGVPPPLGVSSSEERQPAAYATPAALPQQPFLSPDFLQYGGDSAAMAAAMSASAPWMFGGSGGQIPPPGYFNAPLATSGYPPQSSQDLSNPTTSHSNAAVSRQ